MALSFSLEPCLPFAQPWLITLQLGLEHKASVGVNTKLVSVARASVVNT